MSFQVLNDPQHACKLPNPVAYANGTHIECAEIVVGGAYSGGQCGKRFTRTTTFWNRTPRWSVYDWGM